MIEEKNFTFHVSSSERFWSTLVPIVLPFIYYLSEAIFFFRNQKELGSENGMTIGQTFAFYFKIVLSFLLWPAFIVYQIAYYTKKFMIDRENTQDLIKKFDLMYIDAHIIEVCVVVEFSITYYSYIFSKGSA